MFTGEDGASIINDDRNEFLIRKNEEFQENSAFLKIAAQAFLRQEIFLTFSLDLRFLRPIFL